MTFLLFLKMADEQAKPPFNKVSAVPAGYDWPSLLAKDGDELETLGKRTGMLGVIFRKAQNKIQDPAKLRRLIVDLIDKEVLPVVTKDALAGKHGEYEIVLATAKRGSASAKRSLTAEPAAKRDNPTPFGKKSSVTIVNEAGESSKDWPGAEARTDERSLSPEPRMTRQSLIINRDELPLPRLCELASLFS